MKHGIKMIVSDVDGTLVKAGGVEPAQSVLDVLERLNELKIPFSVNSGRQFIMIESLFKDKTDNIYSICQNGSAIYHGHELLWRNPLKRETAIEIADELDKLDGTETMLSTENGYYITKNGPQNDIMRRISKLQKVYPVSSAREVPGEILQVTLFDFKNIHSRLKTVQKLIKGRAEYAISSDACIDINAGDKGTGMLKLAEILGVLPDDILCFGDSYNDLPMLSSAGHPYVMETADAEIKKYFSHFTDDPMKVICEFI